jgi:hypothetical protein
LDNLLIDGQQERIEADPESPVPLTKIAIVVVTVVWLSRPGVAMPPELGKA